MSVVDSILNFTSNIWSMFSSLIRTLWSFFSSVWDVISYVLWIFKTLWFWLVSLVSWVSNLLNQTITWELLSYITEQFINIAKYIWVWPTIFIATLLFLIMFRIVVSFVMKFFRMNIDYNTLNRKYQKLPK